MRVTAPILSQSTTNHQNNSNITTVVRRPDAGQHLSVTQHISVTRYMRHTSHGSNGVCMVHSDVSSDGDGDWIVTLVTGHQDVTRMSWMRNVLSRQINRYAVSKSIDIS